MFYRFDWITHLSHIISCETGRKEKARKRISSLSDESGSGECEAVRGRLDNGQLSGWL